jgi:hypothetical protein
MSISACAHGAIVRPPLGRKIEVKFFKIRTHLLSPPNIDHLQKSFYIHAATTTTMNANTLIGWEPSPAEAQYLFQRVVGNSDLFGTIGDMSVCIRIIGEFKTHFTETHREPPMAVRTLCTQCSRYNTICLTQQN